MKYWLVSFLAIINFSISTAQKKVKGNKNVITIETPLPQFNAISIGESFDINLIKSNSPFIEIETDENLHDAIDFKVEDSLFTITTNAKIRSKKKLNITLAYSDQLNTIEIKDNAKLKSSNNISSDTIKVIISDYSKANLDISSKHFFLNQKNKLKINNKSSLNLLTDFANLNLSHSSKLKAFIKSDSIALNGADNTRLEIEGSTKTAHFNLTGSSDVLGKTFSITTCNAILNEESDLTTQVTDSITINSSGISETYLYGNPQITIDSFANKSKLHKKEL